MRKSLNIILLCTLVMLLCSGCALKDQIDRMMNPDKPEYQCESILDELNSMSMTTETAEAGKKAADAANNLATVKKYKKVGMLCPWMYGAVEAYAENKAAKASSKYAELKSTDSIIRAKREKEQLAEEEQNSKSLWERIFGTNTKKDSSKSNSNMSMIIILVIVILIVIAILLLLNKRGRATPKKATPKKVEQKATKDERTEIKDVKVGADLKVNYDKLLDQACTKLNLDKEEMLRKYDGDARRAYEATNLM